MTAAMIAGQIALTGFAAFIVWTLVWGYNWAITTETQRLTILGNGFTIILSIIALCFLAFGFAVSFQNFKATGPGGVSVDVSGDPEPHV